MSKETQVESSSDFVDLSSDLYIQTYCILKSEENGSPMRDVLFRFGSWCYVGTVELTPSLILEDLPYIIPALRVQHSKMKFLSDARWLPRNNNPFTAALANAALVSTVMENEVSKNEEGLIALIEMLKNNAAATAATDDCCWLDGEQQKTVFEFQFAHDDMYKETYSNIELIATKRYYPSGVVSISIYCEGKHYLTLNDFGGEQRLLDSTFPDVTANGQCFKLCSYRSGVQDWPQLRQISVWENTSAVGDTNDEIEENDCDSETASTNAALQADWDDSCKQTVIISSEPSLQVTDRDDNTTERVGVNIKAVSSCELSNDSYTQSDDKGRKYELRRVSKSSAAASAAGNEHVGPSNPMRSVNRKAKPSKPSLGAFHHLAPLRKPSSLEFKLKEENKIHESSFAYNVESEPWDNDGRPKNLML